MKNITTTLTKLIAEHGLSIIIEQEQSLRAMLADLLPNEKRKRYLLELSFRAEIPRKLIAMQNESMIVWTTQVLSLKHYFKEEFLLEDSAVIAVFDLWILIFPNNSTQTSARLKNEEKIGPLVKINAGHFWGLKNLEGRIVVPCKYEDISDFSDGVATVSYEGKSGLISQNGTELTPLIYRNKQIKFVDGIAVVISQEKKYGLVNLEGKIVLKPQYDILSRKQNIFKAKLAAKYGILNNFGKLIVPIKYDEIEDFNYKIAKVRIADKWGFINELGEEIHPLKYSKIEKLNDFIYLCEYSAGYHLINLQGIKANKFTFNKIFNKFNGPRRVQINDKFGFIDEVGTLLSGCFFENAYNVQYINN